MRIRHEYTGSPGDQRLNACHAEGERSRIDAARKSTAIAGPPGEGDVMFRQGIVALWWEARWVRYAFAAGLVIGLVLGWAFHAVITFFFRFGLAVLLLIPLLLVVYFFWRRSAGRSRRVDHQRSPTQVVFWDPEGRREHVYRETGEAREPLRRRDE